MCVDARRSRRIREDGQRRSAERSTLEHSRHVPLLLTDASVKRLAVFILLGGYAQSVTMRESACARQNDGSETMSSSLPSSALVSSPARSISVSHPSRRTGPSIFAWARSSVGGGNPSPAARLAVPCAAASNDPSASRASAGAHKSTSTSSPTLAAVTTQSPSRKSCSSSARRTKKTVFAVRCDDFMTVSFLLAGATGAFNRQNLRRIVAAV